MLIFQNFEIVVADPRHRRAVDEIIDVRQGLQLPRSQRGVKAAPAVRFDKDELRLAFLFGEEFHQTG